MFCSGTTVPPLPIRRNTCATIAPIFLLLTAIPRPAHAILLIDSPTRHTTAPTGALANSGWQYEGQWGEVAGTAISPHAFLTAAHAGGTVGDTFTLNGMSYTTTGETVIAGTDLAVWQVAETLPTYAPLYDGTDELNQSIVLYGRGVASGSALVVGGNAIGWNWGAYDGQTSWGTNTIDGIVPSGGGLGDLLTFSFNQGDPDTGILAPFDSGGGVFLENNGVWELAGVNYGIEEFYNAPPADGGTAYSAAIYDARGLYLEDGTYIDPNLYTDAVPQQAAASRISPYREQIQSIAGLEASASEPAASSLLFSGIALLLPLVRHLYKRQRGAIV